MKYIRNTDTFYLILSKDYISSLTQNCHKLCKKWKNNKAINTTLNLYQTLELSKVYLKQTNDLKSDKLPESQKDITTLCLRNPVDYAQLDQFQSEILHILWTAISSQNSLIHWSKVFKLKIEDKTHIFEEILNEHINEQWFRDKNSLTQNLEVIRYVESMQKQNLLMSIDLEKYHKRYLKLKDS